MTEAVKPSLVPPLLSAGRRRPSSWRLRLLDKQKAARPDYPGGCVEPRGGGAARSPEGGSGQSRVHTGGPGYLQIRGLSRGGKARRGGWCRSRRGGGGGGGGRSGQKQLASSFSFSLALWGRSGKKRGEGRKKERKRGGEKEPALCCSSSGGAHIGHRGKASRGAPPSPPHKKERLLSSSLFGGVSLFSFFLFLSLSLPPWRVARKQQPSARHSVASAAVAAVMTFSLFVPFSLFFPLFSELLVRGPNLSHPKNCSLPPAEAASERARWPMGRRCGHPDSQSRFTRGRGAGHCARVTRLCPLSLSVQVFFVAGAEPPPGAVQDCSSRAPFQVAEKLSGWNLKIRWPQSPAARHRPSPEGRGRGEDAKA